MDAALHCRDYPRRNNARHSRSSRLASATNAAIRRYSCRRLFLKALRDVMAFPATVRGPVVVKFVVADLHQHARARIIEAARRRIANEEEYPRGRFVIRIVWIG